MRYGAFLESAGTQCGGIADSSVQQVPAFGGIFSSVIGSSGKPGKPTNWDTLVVSLIKLVCRLVQTPLPNVSDANVAKVQGEPWRCALQFFS